MQIDQSTEPIQVIRWILEHELQLKPEQAMLYNQKFDIPPDDRLYLYVGFLGSKTFSSRGAYQNDPVSNTLVQVQTANRQEMYSIHLYSRSAEARLRNWEVSPALAGDFAEQMMEMRSMKIGWLPTSMNDVSGVEGTARLFRYALTIRVLVAYEKIVPVPFYDSFRQPQVITNQ